MTKVIGATEEADMYIRKLAKSLGYFVIRLSDFGKKNAPLDLAGDRYLEWAWMVAHLPDNPGAVMDFGCGDAFLGLTAAIRGGNVVGFDRKPPRVPYFMDNLTMQAGDILDFDFKEVQFDIIMNCSSIEHVGLPGRYDSTNVPNGDLVGMEIVETAGWYYIVDCAGGTRCSFLSIPPSLWGASARFVAQRISCYSARVLDQAAGS
jgi:hypothetical protein